MVDWRIKVKYIYIYSLISEISAKVLVLLCGLKGALSAMMA